MAGRKTARRPVRGAALTVVASILAASSCTPQRRYEVLSFFFDGVPDPDAPVEAGGEISPQFMVDRPASVDPNRPRVHPHEPYVKRPCTTCHPRERAFFVDEGFDRRGRCFTCHEHQAFQERLQTEDFLHGPVALDSCLVCHDAHESIHRPLLLAPDPDLCHGCHEKGAVLAAAYHADLGSTRCSSCHDPHGGSRRYFLREEERRPESRGESPGDPARGATHEPAQERS